MQGKLYLCATPIGNLGDMTPRVIETLNMVDIILCEDTRHSLGLFNVLDIKKPLMSFHKFNFKQMEPKVIKMLQEGKNIALVRDAGMPCISDPGSELIPALIENGLEYTIIPGACAFVNAIIASGFSTKEFCFIGFLPADKPEYIVYVAIDNPKGVTQYGGTVSAPIAKSILTKLSVKASAVQTFWKLCIPGIPVYHSVR